jgi:predicted DNA-binding transcriptional regulator
MERATISAHQIRIFRFVEERGEWLSNREIAAGTEMSERTVRAHTKCFVDEGIFEQREVYPGYRYRFNSQASKRNKAYLQRLEQANEVFSL